jgi:protein SCO1/2
VLRRLSFAAKSSVAMLLLVLLAATPIVENLNERVPLDAPFTNHDGHTVTLRSLLDGQRPIVITPVYFGCQTLCPVVLRGVVESLKGTGLGLGDDFRIVTFSIDPTDTPEQAKDQRTTLLHALGFASGRPGWDFWVGPASSSAPLADALGFTYRYDVALKQYQHSAAFMVLTPDGRIARYLYGVEFEPQQLRLALVEASGGRVGTTVDRVLLTCFRFDPASRRYRFYVQGTLRGGGLLTFLLLGGMLVRLWRRERSTRLPAADSSVKAVPGNESRAKVGRY